MAGKESLHNGAMGRRQTIYDALENPPALIQGRDYSKGLGSGHDAGPARAAAARPGAFRRAWNAYKDALLFKGVDREAMKDKAMSEMRTRRKLDPEGIRANIAKGEKLLQDTIDQGAGRYGSNAEFNNRVSQLRTALENNRKRLSLADGSKIMDIQDRISNRKFLRSLGAWGATGLAGYGLVRGGMSAYRRFKDGPDRDARS